MLINLLLTQVFVVANDQFSALPSIAIDLVMLAVLGAARGAIEREKALEQIEANMLEQAVSDGPVPTGSGVQKAYAD